MQKYLDRRAPREKQPLCASWSNHFGCQGRKNETCHFYHTRSENNANLCPRILSGQHCDGISCPWFHDNALAAVVLAEQAQVRDPMLEAVKEILAFNTAEHSRAKAVSELKYLCPDWLQEEYPTLKPLGAAIKAIRDSAQEGDHDSDAATQHDPDRSKGSN